MFTNKASLYPESKGESNNFLKKKKVKSGVWGLKTSFGPGLKDITIKA